MTVHLTIENEASLPDGGPLSYTISGKRGIDIGRDAYLDWCLPDPTRTVSGKHCEIRYRDGGYWLHDISRNGTFLNRSGSRMQEPHRLRDGDRIEIGRYMIAVRIDGEEAAAEEAAPSYSAPASPAEYWNSSIDAAPPISPKELRPARETRPVQADFREWAIDVPPPLPGYGNEPSQAAFSPPPSFAAPAPSVEDMAWAKGPAAPPPVAAPFIPTPTPRRPSPPPIGGNPWDTSGAEANAWPSPPPSAAAAPSAGWDRAPADEDWGANAAPVAQPQTWPAHPPAPEIDRQPGASSRGAAHAPSADNPWGRPSLAPERAVPEASPPPSSIGSPGLPLEAANFVARFAKGAGLPLDVVGWRDPGDLAEELGVLMRLAAEHLKQLLSARAETKRVARAGAHTMIQALDNNPLKFSPTAEDALKIMLGRPSSGYLDARRALEQSFKDLKVHQVKSYSAMQHALRLLMEDLDPAAVEESIEGDRGLSGLLGSRKAKLWDLYVTRWDTLTSPHEDGMVDAFMMFFAECYDRGGERNGG